MIAAGRPNAIIARLLIVYGCVNVLPTVRPGTHWRTGTLGSAMTVFGQVQQALAGGRDY
jgi:hypothetical protein